MHRLHGFVERRVVASRGAQRGQSDAPEAGRLRAFAGGIGDRDPGSVAVLHVVEPVTADVVGGQHAAGQLPAAEPGDPRWQQALLDLRGRVHVLAPPGGVEDVRVAGAELQRRGAEPRDLAQPRLGSAQREEHTDGAAT